LPPTAPLPPVATATALAGAPQAVSLRGVSKAYKLPHRQYHTLKARALHPFEARTFDLLKAVGDVSVGIAQGEFFGVVGRNGSGKSTLQKRLTWIYDTDAGELHVGGRLSPIIYVAAQYRVSSGTRCAIRLPRSSHRLRHVFVDPTAPDDAAFIGGSVRLLMPLGIIALALRLGLWFFNREAPRIAERL
jgi:ABC-type glutathione transport system ATPase component